MEYDGIPYRVIAPDAEIGEGTVIMPFSFIGSGAKIGKNCYIGQGCYIIQGATIRDGCFFAGNCIIGLQPMVYENEPSATDCTVKIGSNVTFLWGCSVEAGNTVISDNVCVSQNCTVQRGVFVGERCSLLPNCYIALSARLEGDNHLGANTVVGKYAVLQQGVAGAFGCVFKNKTVYKKQSDETVIAGDFNSENTYSTCLAFSKGQFLAWRKKMRQIANNVKVLKNKE